jgi:hypothetical protein
MTSSAASRKSDASYLATEDGSFPTLPGFSLTNLPARDLCTRPPIPVLLIVLLREAGPGGRGKDGIRSSA